MRTPSGTITQSGLRTEECDYGHNNITHPVLGLVLAVFQTDDKNNRSANQNQEFRGHQLEARVLVLNDGSDSPWILPNVVIPPNGTTGADNFSEETPRGTSATLDESHMTSNLTGLSKQKLDGDWCIVDFIGGQIEQPFIVKWWPHPANSRDGTTGGQNGNRTHGRRSVKRFQGTRFAITSKGTVLIDTNEANNVLKKGKRVPAPEGGDIRIAMKPEREFSLNFNPSVFGDPDEPEFLWPPNAQKQTRGTDNTASRFTKTEIELIAGEMVNIIAKRNDVVISTPMGNIKFGVGADEPAVLGNAWKTMMENLIDTILASNVPTFMGPSGPISGGTGAAGLNAIKANLSQQLSEFIFVKKEKA